jgi:hypothetical protein
MLETHNLATAAEVHTGEGSRVILAAQTRSPSFPFTPVSWQNGHAGNGGAQNNQGDCVVASIHADLKMDSRYFAAPLGGAGGDACEGVGTSRDGRFIVVAGGTNSSNFPTTPGAVSSQGAGGFDTFAAVIKRGEHGPKLVYSTFRGGTSDDLARWAAVPPSDSIGPPNVFTIGGMTKSASFPGAPTYNKPAWDGLAVMFKK